MPASRYSDSSDPSQQTLAVVMAGGNGTRLGELTRWHSKPALPFGGQYRNIDFPLSNCVNSGIRRIALATQYKAHSLIQHVHIGWSFLRPEVGEFIELWPAQQRCGTGWYAGTADAIYQNLDLIEPHVPAYVLILAGDHIYKMDYRAMLQEHIANGADLTVGCVEVPIASASAFGIIETDAPGWITRFDEKPASPSAPSSRFGTALASMGIYVFDRDFLVQCLRDDAADANSRHDFGRDVLPSLIGKAHMLAHAFRDPRDDSPAYWRDVGTVDSYWRTNMELLDDNPPLALHDSDWPIWTHQGQYPPPIFTGAGSALRSIVSGGCRVAGAVEHSILSQNCAIGAGAVVESSVVLPNATIGRNCRIRHAIVESGCTVPDDLDLGDDLYAAMELCRFSAEGVALITSEAIERALAPSRPPEVARFNRR